MADKNVVEKYEHGEFNCRWVDEVLPLGEDRKTIFVPVAGSEKIESELEVVNRTRAEMFAMTTMMMNALVERFGDEIWEVAGKLMYDIGYNRGMEFATTMKIDPTDARSVGRILDLEDSTAGVKGEWIETGKKRAVKREFNCPYGAALSLCPDYCTRLISEVERGTFDAIGVKIKDFSIPKLISKGDPYCEAVIELEG